MSFSTLHLEHSSLLSDEANEYLTEYYIRAIPNENFLRSELPLPLRNLQCAPFVSQSNVDDTILRLIFNFEVRLDDVFVCSLPKCGSSWTEVIVWLLMHNLDYETIQTVKRYKLMADFESHRSFCDESFSYETAWLDYYNKLNSSRVIKTHLPVFALPKRIWSMGAKVIYITRNPKDMAVSDYHFRRNAFPTDIKMDDVINGLINDKWVCSPYLEHILNYWNIRNLPNVCVVAYEDLVQKPFTTIKMMIEFLERHYTDEQLKQLIDFISFENMKKNRAVNREEDLVEMQECAGKKALDPTFS